MSIAEFICVAMHFQWMILDTIEIPFHRLQSLSVGIFYRRLLRSPSPFGQSQGHVLICCLGQLLPYLLFQAGKFCVKMNLISEDTGFLKKVKNSLNPRPTSIA